MLMFDNFSIYEIMSLVGLSTDKIRSSSGGGYYTCPVCGRKGKFNINPSIGYGGVVRCAACNIGGDKLDLYILASGRHFTLTNAVSKSGSIYERPCETDRSEALVELADRLHIERKNDGFIAKACMKQKQVEENDRQEAGVTRPPQEIDQVYRAFLNMLSLNNAHREKLHERGLSDEDIERISFRTTPLFRRPQLAQALVDLGLSLEGIPGFFKLTEVDETTGEVKEIWSVYCPDSGYFIPIRDRDGYIVSMQIRLNKPTTDKDKYRFFSSNKDSLESGTKANSVVHVELCGENPRYLYIVEGAIKAYVAHALYKGIYGKDDMLILAVPGVSNLGGIPSLLDWLLPSYDFENIVEWYDIDKFTNPNVSKARDNLERLVRDSMKKWREKLCDKYESGELSPPKFISFPNERYKGKGIDDHLLVVKSEMLANIERKDKNDQGLQ